MTLSRIVHDARESFESLTKRNVRNCRVKSRGPVHELNEEPEVVQIQTSCWANLPPELLLDVVKRLEASESTWPGRKHLVACAAVCRSWRTACKRIVTSPELCKKLTFPTSLKQPGSRNGSIQCFIKRDKTNMTFRLFLCLSPALPVESGKFLLSAKRTVRPTYTEFVISMDADNISCSSSSFIGRMRSDLLRREYVIYDTQPPQACTHIPLSSGQGRSKFLSKEVLPRAPTGGSYKIAQVSYNVNFSRTRGPRRINCIMHSIPESTVDVGDNAPGQTEPMPYNLENSFRNLSFSKSVNFPKIGDSECNECKPFVLKSRRAWWHEKLQCWCLNFHGRVTVASVKNFQLLASTQPDPIPVETSSKPRPPRPNVKVFLQFGKISKDMFTMEYNHPLSAFQAFAICLSNFEAKLFCQ